MTSIEHIYKASNEVLVLAVLSEHLNLNPNRLNLILSYYPNIMVAIDDRFSGLIYSLESKPRNYKFESKWLLKIKAFDWSGLGDLKGKLAYDLEKNEIGLLTFRDFPSSLIDSGDYPLVLFYQGDWSLLHKEKNLSIVGSRQINSYSESIISDVLESANFPELNIVSGLALGVDTLAHQIALKIRSQSSSQNLKCIAFIGSGHGQDVFYPSSNFALKNQIVDAGGLVCSEYPPNFRATKYTFPRRNRFVASLSTLTWVVQASQRSGALITAKLALELGKTVATTPASVLDTDFGGNLQLLRDGAQIVANTADLLQLLDFSDFCIKPLVENTESKALLQANITSVSEVDISKTQIKKIEIDWGQYPESRKIIFDSLSFGPCETQEIYLKTKIPISTLTSELSLMELGGLVENLSGKWTQGELYT